MSPRSRDLYTVLVVDDDPSVLATYRRLLTRAGYRVVVEDDPHRALEIHAEHPVDLLLIDYKMPGMDGLSLLAAMRQRECAARCILLSAFINDDVEFQARTLGVARILHKPVDACVLRGTIQELLPVNGGSAPKGTSTVEYSDESLLDQR